MFFKNRIVPSTPRSLVNGVRAAAGDVLGDGNSAPSNDHVPLERYAHWLGEMCVFVLEQGVDMVRISDARMSGTAYGTVILHTSPEAAAGGPLAVVRNGDMIEVDVAGRRVHLDITDEELAARLAEWKPAHERFESGYGWLHQQHVEGADTGADLDFLKGCRGNAVGKDAH